MTTTRIDWEGGAAVGDGSAAFVRLAAVELLMREYHWSPVAAGRFADRLVADAAGAAERARRLRETLDERGRIRMERERV